MDPSGTVSDPRGGWGCLGIYSLYSCPIIRLGSFISIRPLPRNAHDVFLSFDVALLVLRYALAGRPPRTCDRGISYCGSGAYPDLEKAEFGEFTMDDFQRDAAAIRLVFYIWNDQFHAACNGKSSQPGNASPISISGFFSIAYFAAITPGELAVDRHRAGRRNIYFNN